MASQPHAPPATIAFAALILALFLVHTTYARRLAAEGPGNTRRFFIAANEITWDYAPLGINNCQDREFSTAEELVTIKGLGLAYTKAQYQAYTDGTFTKLLKRPADEEHLALLGPLLRAEVGDRVVVELKNNLNFVINFEPSGLLATSKTYDLLTKPNTTEVYEFAVPEQAGPSTAQSGNSVLWLYRSTAEDDQQAHQNAGLYGPIIIARRGFAGKDGKATDVDREFVTIYFINDENESPFYDHNVAKLGGKDGRGGLTEDELVEANLKHAINGRQFCNLEGLNGKTEEKIRWHAAALGNEADVHNLHWHGLVLEKDNTYTDQFNLLASNTASADLIADNPGVWMVHCHVNDHLAGGMVALLNLTGASTGLEAFKSEGVLRTYYVQAQEEAWDMAPAGGNLCSGTNLAFTKDESVYVTNQPDRIGRKPIKARFVEYTDDTFTTPRVRTAAEVHLGMLGPIIRAEVGDTVHVVFRNKVRFPSSVHPHGVLYNKSSEGTPYNDGTTGADKADDLVLTNQTHTYVWQVPERSGPGKAETSSKIWMYHSHSDEAADTWAGLMGAIIISRRGSSRPDGTPLDVDREFVLFWMVTDESQSSLFVTNLNKYLSSKYIGKGLPQVRSEDPGEGANNTRGGNVTTSLKQPESIYDAAGGNKALLKLLEDPDFKESNLKHGINGFLYCNLPGLEAVEGQRIRIYHMALGSEVDLHTPGIRGTSQNWLNSIVPVVSLLAGDMQTADTQLTTPGASLLECNVADHIDAGMRALFLVQPANGSVIAGPNDMASPQVETFASPRSLPAAGSPDGKQAYRAAALPSSTGTAPRTAAISSNGLLADSKAAAFSKAAAGSFAVPLMDLVYAFGVGMRKGLAAMGVTSPTLQSVAKTAPASKPLSKDVTRTYFIQAEEKEWDYSPAKKNRCTGEAFEGDEVLYTTKTNTTLGPLAAKALYRGYTDSTFSRASKQPTQLGLLGPLLQAQVGDTLKVVFRNSLPFEVSLVFDGGLIPMNEAGALAPVQPNKTVTVTYSVPVFAGPGTQDASTVHYVYRSNVDLVAHEYAGLVGVIMIARKGTLTPEGTIPGIDLVVPLLFQVWDESKSPFFENNIKKYNPTVNQESEDFEEGNLKHSINGLLYCNLPDVKVKMGGRVRWLLTGLGTENDMHSPVFTNQVLEFNHAHVPSVQLYPAVTYTADMVAKKPGVFGFHCDVVDHIAGGMMGRLAISA